MKPGWEWLLVLLIVLLLFGAKRLPDTARSLGRSMRILKAETKGLRDDEPGEGTSQGSEHPAGAEHRDATVQPPAPALPPAGTSPVQPGGPPDAASSPASAGQHRDER